MNRLTLAFWAVLGVAALAAGPPQYKDYPVTRRFRGTPVAPVLSTPTARMFRTQLRKSVRYGPNFAGHYTLARWGCGAGCVTVAVIDAISGQVWFAPFTVNDGWKDGRIVCHHGTDFQVDSQLFIASGSVNGKTGAHYFRWRGSEFSSVYSDAQCLVPPGE